MGDTIDKFQKSQRLATSTAKSEEQQSQQPVRNREQPNCAERSRVQLICLEEGQGT